MINYPLATIAHMKIARINTDDKNIKSHKIPTILMLFPHEGKEKGSTRMRRSLNHWKQIEREAQSRQRGNDMAAG